MADSELAGITEDVTPDLTDNLYMQSADGNTDKRVPLSALGTHYQAVDSDLTAIAALSTTAYGRAFLALADAAAGRTALSLGTAATSAVGDFQPVDSDLTAIAALTTTATGRSLLAAADAAAIRVIADAVGLTGNETIAGVKTFSSDPLIPDEAYDEAAWNGVLEPPTKNAVRDKFEALDEIVAGVRTSPDTSVPGDIGIDVDLSSGIPGGDTLTGGTSGGEELTLASTSNAARGKINLRDRVMLITEDKTYDTGTGVFTLIDTPSTRTITLNHATTGANRLEVIRFAPTVVWDVNSATFAAFLFNSVPTYKNVNGEARTINGTLAVLDSPTIQADGATVTYGGHAGFLNQPTLAVLNAGTLNATALTAFTSALTVGASCTVTTRTGLLVSDSTGSGTVTTGIGVDIATMTHATTSIGLRCAAAMVYTPTTKAITAASDTIPITARIVRLNNTSGGSVTLTSAPTLADGQNGQVIKLLNTSANNVVIQDQGTLASSNLRLTATTVTIAPRQSVELTYSSTVGDWVQTTALVAVI